ncbi:uncharacterized protein LOC129725999 [Wyeomyia smithii]|uniref:uncharacterized protein LOC129725999 n=1 Tax=Wyeomyia smithii TaxID=174621 RepID=UPI0024681BD9|nr:uncharacterized protein LOC129725999 [Wyeomyia smithii]
MRKEYISLAAGCCFLSIFLTVVSLTAAGHNRLMESVMLNRDILEMLRHGGFDKRQPARIFLPPKFYSSLVFDSGPRSPEDILRTNLQLMMEAVYDGSLLQMNPPVSSKASAVNRPNAIPYAKEGAGNHNKGRETLAKNKATNLKVFSPSTSLTAPYPAAASRKSSSLAPLQSIMADQTRSEVAQIIPSADRRVNAATRSDHNRGSSLGYNLRLALPGEPDVDYPILGHIPDTGFSCFKRRDGYYADVEARCQVFRVCANTDDTGSGFAFLCPNGTLFNQKYFVCDWYMNVRCEESENYYDMNEQLGKSTAEFGQMMGAVMSMVSFPMVSSLLGDGKFDSNGRKSLLKNDYVNRQSDGDGKGGTAKPWDQTQYTRQRQQSAGGKPHTGERNGEDEGYQSKFNQGSTYGENAAGKAGYVSTGVPEQVYVSSLGTLSTDPQSGFDPARSTFLIPPTMGYNAVPPQLNGDFPSLNLQQQLQQKKHHYSNEETSGALPISNAEFELLMAKLLKTWTNSGYAKTPQLPAQRPILPPSGVLPPSSGPRGFQQFPSAGGKSQIVHIPTAPRNPNLSTVQNVFRVQKAYVVPASYYPGGTVTSAVRPTGYPKAPPAIAWAGLNVPRGSGASFVLASLQDAKTNRRNDVVRRLTAQPSITATIVRRNPQFEVEIIPASSYYLNNDRERQSYQQTLHSNIGSTQRVISQQSPYSGTSSYNVPVGSIGPFYSASY